MESAGKRRTISSDFPKLAENSQKIGCVAKNMLGHINTKRHFSSGGNIEAIHSYAALPQGHRATKPLAVRLDLT